MVGHLKQQVYFKTCASDSISVFGPRGNKASEHMYAITHIHMPAKTEQNKPLIATEETPLSEGHHH